MSTIMGTRLIILFSLVASACYAQKGNFAFKYLKFRGLDFNTTELSIVKSLGKKNKVAINEDNYPCGLFYSDSGEKFYHLNYNGFNFTGNDRTGYFLENINFDAAGKIKITYKNKILSGLTTKSELLKVFSDVNEKNFSYPEPDQEVILIYTEYHEDGAEFTFKNGRLIKFSYWYLC